MTLFWKQIPTKGLLQKNSNAETETTAAVFDSADVCSTQEGDLVADILANRCSPLWKVQVTTYSSLKNAALYCCGWLNSEVVVLQQDTQFLH